MVVQHMIKIAIVALVFILFDIITGFLKAAAKHDIDSTILRKGLLHKLSEIVSIVFAFLCEYAVQFVELGVNLPLVAAVCAYIILMEIISIIENLVEVNPDMGKFFQKYLKGIKEEVDKDAGKTDDNNKEGE